MDIAQVQQLIASLGFPIVCVLGLGFFIYKMWNDSRQDLKDQIKIIEENSRQREEKLTEQIEKFGDSLNSFNLTLTKIDTRLEYLEKVRGEENNNK